MRVLIAEDDRAVNLWLNRMLATAGYEVIATHNGTEAYELLLEEDGPCLAVIDWMMPGMSGLEVCRSLRRRAGERPLYVILLTAKASREDIVEGLLAGADDYITKPFDSAELWARVRVGDRVVSLQSHLAQRAKELGEALGQVRRLQGILPICSYCKKIRDDRDSWR